MYQRSYVLSQQVRKGSTRVDIGCEGYLLSMTPYPDEADKDRITTLKGIRFLADDPAFSE